MLIPLKLVRDQPLQQQLYEQLRGLIASARLQSGARMPSTRMLAEQFSISRITVLLVYERLIAEGYLETLPAKGTFVARLPTAAASECHCAAARPGASLRPQAGADVAVGCADPQLFPAGRWRALTRNTLDRFGSQLAQEHAGGHPALRSAIAGWLSTSRGLAVDPDQVIPVNCRQQALHIVAHLLLTPGARIVVEDPGDGQALAAFADARPGLLRLPVDRDGLCTAFLPPGQVAMAYVTPEHQRPLGVTLSGERRAALLAWAAHSGAMVVEDDCDGELRYHGMDVPPLMSLDANQRVIRVGGFSCSLGPWVKLAYMVVPPPCIAPAIAARRAVDDSLPWLESSALADFLLCGGYARHVHRLAKAYVSRRDALLAALRRHLGEDTTVWGEGGGLHVAWLPPAHLGPASRLARLAVGSGLEAAAVAGEGARAPASAVLLGFGNLNEAQIESRIARFAGALRLDAAKGAAGAAAD